MEDAVYFNKGELAKSNVQFVKRIVELANTLGREIATPDEARETLGDVSIKELRERTEAQFSVSSELKVTN